MPTLSEYWVSGFRALHLEECINNTFADFAPYGGADQQRIVVSRQSPSSGRPATYGTGRETGGMAAVGTPIGPASHVASSSTVVVEDNGDFSIQMRDPHTGSVSFSTAGNLHMEVAARMDLPVSSFAELDKIDSASAPRNVSVTPTGEMVIPPIAKVPPPQQRFSDFTRPLTAPAMDQPAAAAAGAAASWGQLELDMNLPEWREHRQSAGLRVGPAAMRVARMLSSETSALSSSPMNSTSLSDEDNGTATGAKKRRYQYTLDTAVCVPLTAFQGNSAPSAPFGRGASMAQGLSSSVAASAAAATLDRKPIILTSAAPWAVTCGFQYPLTLGDTLVGLSLQNDRTTSVLMPYPGVEWAVPSEATASSSVAPSTSTVDSSVEAAMKVPCVPYLLYPSAEATHGDGATKKDATSGSASAAACSGLPHYVAIPPLSVRLVLVQTLASHTLKHRSTPDASGSQLENSTSGDGASASSISRIASSYDWRQLPTLLGINVGFDRDRLRLSAATILHNGEVDLEGAAVLDLTPWMPHMPTLLKFGYNNAGRLAAGISSLLYGTVTATLGMHMARAEQTKFGIEVSL